VTAAGKSADGLRGLIHESWGCGGVEVRTVREPEVAAWRATISRETRKAAAVVRQRNCRMSNNSAQRDGGWVLVFRTYPRTGLGG